MQLYNVALWRYFSSAELPIVEDVEAASPLLAALALMQRHKLHYVGRAAVASPDKTIERWPGLRLEQDLHSDDEPSAESEAL